MFTHRLLFVLCTFALFACSRSSPAGAYETHGSDDKFKMGLELRDNGTGQFVTRSNVGDPRVDRAAEALMTITDGRWSRDGQQLVLTGKRGDGKVATFKFAIQENGDLIWTENGARFAKNH